MRLKVDENLGRRAVDLLRRAGLDAVGVSDEGLCSAPDRLLLEVCRKEDRCLVTLDLDFANPFLHPPEGPPGIIVVRLPSRPRRESLDRTLQTLVRALQERSPRNRLWIVETERVREYRPAREEERVVVWRRCHQESAVGTKFCPNCGASLMGEG